MHQESVAYLSVFFVRKLKQATSSSICAVTYPEILLKHRETEKKVCQMLPNRWASPY